jgi:muramoyltetrapeptide carboxypeptidase
MRYIKPKRLNKGDTIGIISPASSTDDFTMIENGTKYIEQMGYRTILGPNVGKSRGFLAGTDEERIEDIYSMFSNKKVKAIICIRGGYGAVRLLDKIDYKIIRSNPKIFVGYSEITALQMAFLKKAGLITFAGPMVVPNFSKDVSGFTEENFWQIITSGKKVGKIKCHGMDDLPNINPCKATGRIVGGNLSVFTSLIGTEYLPELINKILLVEDTGEPPYKIDRMLNQLRLNGIFEKVSGVILGQFTDCDEPDKKKRTLTINEVINNYIKLNDLPTVSNFPHGHIKDFITVPFGINIKLNTTDGYVEFMESAVR